MTTKWAGAKDWYQLTFQGQLVEEGEDKCAEFCIKAQKLGRGARVQSIKHTQHSYEPFGFDYFPSDADIAWRAIHDAQRAVEPGVPDADTVLQELERVVDFLEGICISQGPQAAAFTTQQLDYIAHARAVIARAKPGARPDTDKEVVDALQSAVVELQRLHNIHGLEFAGKIGEPNRAIIAEGDAVLRALGRVGVYGLPTKAPAATPDTGTSYVIAVGDPFNVVSLYGPFSKFDAAERVAQGFTGDPWWVVDVRHIQEK